MKQKFTFKGIGLSLLFSFLFLSSYGQTVVSDSGSCVSHTLHAVVTGTVPTASGITLDDGYSSVIPIGFSFNFYGTSYNQLVIGSNGVINFTSSLAGAYCPWPISAALLGNPSMRNAVCGPWCDVFLLGGDQITYSTIGTAPNRKFAVTWCGTHMFSCTTQYLTSQIIIYESTNLVEVHTAHHTVCAWNGGYAITGVQNAAGTAATVAPGRDYPTNWTVIAPPEAWRFTPDATFATYAVTSIPYAPAPYATSAIYWYDSATYAYLGTGPYLTVTPTVGTTYMAVTLGCNDSTKTYYHVDPVSTGVGGIPHIRTYTYTNPTECGKCDGTITLYGVNPHQVDTVFYSIGGVAQPRYVDSAHVDSTITLSNLCGAVYDYVYVKVADCPSNQIGPVTLVTPVLAISHDSIVNPSVCGYYDGSITLYGLTPGKFYHAHYTRDGLPVADSGMVAADSSVVLHNLDAGTYNPISITVGLCTATWGPVTLTDPAPYAPSFTFEVHPGCAGDTVIVTNTTTPAGYFSYWNYGEGPTPDSVNLYHIYHTEPAYVLSQTITLTYNTVQSHKAACQLSTSATVNIDHHINAAFSQSKDTNCATIPILFTNGTSSANPATYSWNFGDANTSTDVSPEHAYSVASNTQPGGVYTTVLTATDSVLGCVSTYAHNSYIASVDVKAPNDTSVCLRDSMTMRAGDIDIRGIGTIVYAWTMSDGSVATNLSDNNIKNPKFFGIGTFHYNLGVTLYPAITDPSVACYGSDDQTIYSYPPITFIGLTASPQVVANGSSIQLNAGGATYYTWTPNNGTLSDPNISNPVATPVDSVTDYVVHGRTEFGCLADTTIRVYLDYDNTVFNPTGFTPNGDGKNDYFRPAKMFRFQKLVEMRVYNRWGQVLFQSSNPEIGWDGNFNGVPQDMGTYTYELIAGMPDGSQKVYKGTVTLIR